MKDIFIIHHSVFNDAFRDDYDTVYRDSSKIFFKLLLKHWTMYKQKIAFTSGEVYAQLQATVIGKTKTFGVIHEYLCEVDFGTFNPNEQKHNLDQSILRLFSKKCIEFKPFIVATCPKNNIKQEGTAFIIITPKEATEIYENTNSRFF